MSLARFKNVRSAVKPRTPRPRRLARIAAKIAARPAPTPKLKAPVRIAKTMAALVAAKIKPPPAVTAPKAVAARPPNPRAAAPPAKGNAVRKASVAAPRNRTLVVAARKQ